MKQEYKNIDEWIVNYLTNELTEQELDKLQIWRNLSTDNENYFKEQKEIWFSAIGANDVSYNSENAFLKFKEKVCLEQKKKRTEKYFNKITIWWKYAAAVILLFLVSYFSYWQGEENIKNIFADIVIEVPLGSQTTIFLPDGTSVCLNAGSKITYSQGFGVNNRLVELSGEAYFEVQKNKLLPFSVKTKDLYLEVLGTKFNFCNYPEDEKAFVSLAEGSVKIVNQIKEESVYLKPDQRIILDKRSGKMLMEQKNASNDINWTNGYLFFDEEKLTDIIKELERSYDISIELMNETIKEYNFYGNFTRREQSVTEILDALSSTRKIEYTIEGKTIRIY